MICNIPQKNMYSQAHLTYKGLVITEIFNKIVSLIQVNHTICHSFQSEIQDDDMVGLNSHPRESGTM